MKAQPLRSTTVGEGPPVVLLHGFGLAPTIYRATADLMAKRLGVRVVMPWIFALGERLTGGWDAEHALAGLVALLDDQGIRSATLLGHSFGGGIELALAANFPDRVEELVFCDTLANNHSWSLAVEAFRPTSVLRMATFRAAKTFFLTALTWPRQLLDAAWWGFTSDRRADAARVRSLGIPSHVLWAARDTLLSRTDGNAFAAELGATFTVAKGKGGTPVDHDWMYRHPDLFVSHLEDLGLSVARTKPRRTVRKIST